MASQNYNDRKGNYIGRIEESKGWVWDHQGTMTGRYDGTYTYDKKGNIIGKGDMRASLLSVRK